MTQASRLGEYLRSMRQARGITVQDVAQMCQMPVSVLLDVEHGDRPDTDTLAALAEGLAMNLVDLHRLAQGELLNLPLLREPMGDVPPVPEEEERSPTLLEAIQGLSPAQLEKVLDYVQLLKLAERGRRHPTPL